MADYCQSPDCTTTGQCDLRMYSVICFVALRCDHIGGCTGSPGTTCVAEYCQPEYCSATGECVFGQICSQNANSRTCVCTSVRYMFTMF